MCSSIVRERPRRWTSGSIRIAIAQSRSGSSASKPSRSASRQAAGIPATGIELPSASMRPSSTSANWNSGRSS